jgi:hypothetical protein
VYSEYTEYGSNNWYSRNNDILRIKIAAAFVIAILALWGCIHIITYRKHVTAEVVGYYWYRGINIEQWQEVEESGWHVPDGGREIRHYRAKYDRERYKCGEDEEGDTKYCYRDIYRTKYDYHIDKWIVITRYEREGITQEDVIWPNVEDLLIHNPVQYGDKKPGMSISRYVVTFKVENESTYYDVDMVESMWYTFTIESKHKIILGFFNNIIEVQ